MEESEEKLTGLQLQYVDPEVSLDYTKLMEIQQQIEEEEQKQESLLERMLETETELEELEQLEV